MKKTEVLFFFDTEDFTSECAAEAILREAEICSSEGITGHFAVVGLLAKQLASWGRHDIIDALKTHIIGTHTYGHTLHPDICESSDLESFDEAYQNVARDEDRAIELINDVLAPQRILFACPPGNSKSYVAMYYYADKGIPFYCDTVVNDGRGTALHYCNQEHIDYVYPMESSFFNENPDIDGIIEGFIDRDRIIIYTHPNIAVKTEFWDVLNYDKTNLREFGSWIEANDRAPEQTERFYRCMRELIRKLKCDGRFEITNLYNILSRRKPRVLLTKDMLPQIKSSLSFQLTPIKEPSYSVSDIFFAAVDFLNEKSEYSPSKVYGFLSEPHGVTKTCRVSTAGLKKAAAEIRTDTFIPECITVDGIALGPADFLLAALKALTDGCEEIVLTPSEQLVSIDALHEMKTLKMNGKWRHSDDFRDKYLSDRLRLQCWTLRYE